MHLLSFKLGGNVLIPVYTIQKPLAAFVRALLCFAANKFSLLNEKD